MVGAILGGVQALGGIAQAVGGAIQAKRANRSMEQMVNSYQPNASINDFYNKAYNNYSANPYNSSLYRMQQQNIERSTASGMNAFADRRAGVAGVGSLVQGQNDALLKAAAGAEQQQASNLRLLGSATQVKAAEDFRPFEMKYNMLGAKAAGGNQIMNAGLNNIFGGLGTAATSFDLKGDKKPK